MKKLNYSMSCLTLVASLAWVPAEAALVDRGGGLIYDTVQNLTWLADANYAGKIMSWQQAKDWVSGLSYHDSVRNVDYNDWRLPTVTDLGAPGCNYSVSGTDCGFNVDPSSSQLAHLFHIGLENRSAIDANGQSQTNYGVYDDPANPSDENLFSNIPAGYYWLGSKHNDSEQDAWYMNLNTGYQHYGWIENRFYVWAVRKGDVAAVPLPGAAWLFASGLIAFSMRYRRRNG